MSYLEKEITSSLETNHLKNQKLKKDELEKIISDVKTCFFTPTKIPLTPSI